MQQLDIYIEQYKLDIDNDTQVNLTYRYSDLINPANITGDFSKTIKVKGTPNNNQIFGNIWNLDRKIIFSENSNVSVSFNPSKRTKAVICINNAVFKSGYVKLNKVSVNKGVITYEITFYSDLCDILKGLKDVKLTELDYINNLRHVINKEAVRDFWNNNHDYSNYMTYVMTNSGMYENFENDKWITKSGNNYVIQDILNGAEFDELSRREYRSYYQRPALKLPALFDTIQYDYNNNSDFTLNYDSDFFSNANPYFNNSVLALARMNTEETLESHTGEMAQTLSISISNPDGTGYRSAYFNFNSNNEYFNGTAIYPSLIDSQVQIDVEFEIEITGKVTLPSNENEIVYRLGPPVDDIGFTWRLNPEINTYIYEAIPYNTIDETTAGIDQQYIEIVDRAGSFKLYIKSNMYNDFNGQSNVYSRPCRFYVPSQSYTDAVGFKLTFLAPSSITVLNAYNQVVELPLTSVNCKIKPITKVPVGKPKTNYIPGNFTGNGVTLSADGRLKSNGIVTLDKMLNDNETTVGDFLIDYTKLFGLIWDVKDNQINITTKNNFFKDYEILDWSDKIDYSKSIDISPISFDKSKLSLKYNNAETKYEKHYEDRFGTEYGEQLINTGYEFDEGQPENLISDMLFDNTIMSVENTQYYTSNGTSTSTQWLLDDKVLPATFVIEDGVRNQSETTYNLLFDNGWKTTNYRYYVSDDLNDLSTSTDKPDNPVWINQTTMSNNMLGFTTYRQFSRLTSNGLYSWDIGYPKENYAKTLPSDYQPSATIFSRYWQNYISEIYDANNKVMTCYVLLTPDDMANFSFKNFININNTLWHVNQIIDYNPVSLQPTKVELMQVSSRDAIENAYVNGQRID